MITNEKQYKISKAQAQKFLDAYEAFEMSAHQKQRIAEELIDAQKQALLLQYKELAKEIEQYESLKSGEVQSTKAHSINELPKILIMSRIAQGITQADLAKRLNLKPQQIQRYEADMYATANFRRLNDVANALGVEFRRNTEFALDTLSDENWNLFPIKEMLQRGWFGDFDGTLKQAQKAAKDLVSEFFDLAGMQNSLRNVLHKKNPRSGSKINQYALLAWQARVVQRAFFSPLKTIFRMEKIDNNWIKNLVSLSAELDGPLRAKQYLEDAGIHLIIEPHLDGTHLDGAAIKGADNAPIVAITLRYDRADNFWFILLHELGHIIKHLYCENCTQNEFVDEDLDQSHDDPMETEANEFAQETLISSTNWEISPVRFIANKETIIQQAENWGISPAIIAGRVLREAENYKAFPELVKFVSEHKVRHILGEK